MGGPFEHFGLIGVASDEPIHLHLALLADSVRSGSGLHVVLRVPIRVVDDDNVRAGEVDADSSGFGG